MKIKLHKMVKIVAGSLVAILAVALLAIFFVVYIVFTPEKLTPLVTETANNLLRAKVNAKSVDLTFFSTFPQFGLEVKEGSLVSNQSEEAVSVPSDSLLSFKKCLIEVRPLDFIFRNALTIKRITLSDAQVYAFRDEQGLTNWDIVPEKEPDVAEDTTEVGSLHIQRISVEQVAFERAYLTFDDRQSDIFVRGDSLNLRLGLALQREHSELQLQLNNKNFIFWQKGELLLNHIQTEMETALSLDHVHRKITLHNASVSVNGLKFGVSGSIANDSLQQWYTDIQYRLDAPSVENVLRLIPEKWVKHQSVKTGGSVMAQGTVIGHYGNGALPEATMHIKVSDVSLHYDKMPYGIDHADLEFKSFVDLMRRRSSTAHLKINRIEGVHTKITADVSVNDLLTDPHLSFTLGANVDLTALAQTFPLQEGVTAEGKFMAALKGKGRLSSLQKKDFGKLRAEGQLQCNQLLLSHPEKDFLFESDATFDFSGREQLEANLSVQNIKWHSPSFETTLKSLEAQLASTPTKDSTRVTPFKCRLRAGLLSGKMGDSLGWSGVQVKAMADVQADAKREMQPQIALSLEHDSLRLVSHLRTLFVDKGGFGLKLTPVNDTVWSPSGIIGFHQLRLTTPELKLPILMERSNMTVKNQQLNLKNATLHIGKSDLTANGAILNLYDAYKYKHPVQAQLKITSNELDANQLIGALALADDTLAVVSDTVSSDAPMTLFAIPKSIDFEMDTRLNKVKYGKMVFEQVHGAVDMRNQAIHLKELSMRGLDADMRASLVYHAADTRKGYVGFDFNLEEVNVGKLVDFIPALDTIVPMLRSFEGIVDFHAVAETHLDSMLNIQLPTLRSAVNIRGDSLVLMDGETFAEISKMMMFKNKNRNLIDSVYVNMTVNEGKVTVYPFVIQMDRYRVAVGGTQDLDMNFKYHISVLKSPVPFKLGVNITGNLDKMKIRVGKAKYKDQVTPVAVRKVDSTRIHLGQDIVRDFQQFLRKR